MSSAVDAAAEEAGGRGRADGDGREVPGWTPYREWFRARWAEGGAVAWGTALGHLLVGAALFALVAGFDLARAPVADRCEAGGSSGQEYIPNNPS